MVLGSLLIGTFVINTFLGIFSAVETRIKASGEVGYINCDVGFNVLEDKVIPLVRNRMTQPGYEPTMIFADLKIIKFVYIHKDTSYQSQ